LRGANCKDANIRKGYCENLTWPCSYCQVVDATFGIEVACIFFQIVCKKCRVQLNNKVKSSIYLNIYK
jgi:hypothetical protein